MPLAEQVRPAQVRDQGGSLRAPPPAAEDAVAAGRRSEGLLSEQAIASGRAAFRERYEAHKRQQAAEAARDAQARSLVRQWEQQTEAYTNGALHESLRLIGILNMSCVLCENTL